MRVQLEAGQTDPAGGSVTEGAQRLQRPRAGAVPRRVDADALRGVVVDGDVTIGTSRTAVVVISMRRMASSAPGHRAHGAMGDVVVAPSGFADTTSSPDALSAA